MVTTSAMGTTLSTDCRLHWGRLCREGAPEACCVCAWGAAAAGRREKIPAAHRGAEEGG